MWSEAVQYVSQGGGFGLVVWGFFCLNQSDLNGINAQFTDCLQGISYMCFKKQLF